MITRVELEHFRGIEKGLLGEMRPLTVLVGPNGSGKSTVLDALLIGAHPDPGEAIARAGLRRRGVQDPARWLVPRASPDARSRIHVTVGEDWRETRLRVRADATGFDTRGLSQGPFVVAFAEVEGVSADLAAAQADSGAPDMLHQAAEAGRYEAGGKIVFGYDLQLSGDSLRGPAVVPAIALVDPTAVPRAGETAGRALALRFARLDEVGKSAAANDLVRQLAPGRTGLKGSYDLAGSPVLVADSPSGSLPVAMLGDGIAQLVGMALELAAVDGGVALLEEPEAHLYPTALRALSRLLVATVARGVQIVIATHSLALIDELLVDATELVQTQAASKPADADASGVTRAAEDQAPYHAAPSEEAALDELLCVVRTTLVEGQLGTVVVKGGAARRLRWHVDEDLR